MLGGLSLLIRQVLVMMAPGTTLASVGSPNSKRDRVYETLTFKGVQHLEEADPSPRREMEVMRSVPKRSMPSVGVITMESADRALMPASVAERIGTWSRTTHRTGVRLKVMLSLGLI